MQTLVSKTAHQQALLTTMKGVTLVELMFVVAIIGLLSIVVFPSFQSQIQKSRRADGTTQLLRLKLQQEVFRTKNTSYALAKQLNLPKSDYYMFSVNEVTSTTYELVATAKGSQIADKLCKTLSINQSMQKKPEDCFK